MEHRHQKPVAERRAPAVGKNTATEGAGMTSERLKVSSHALQSPHLTIPAGGGTTSYGA
jgi:hypothetical protein